MSTTQPVILITGASRGIGRTMAVAFAGAGARTALMARSATGLDETLEAVRDAGGTGAAHVADVADEAAVREAYDALTAELGPVDVLINNAGITVPMGPMWEIPPERWWQTVEVNLQGTYVCSRVVLPGMVERGHGRIVNVTSNAGAHRWPYFTAYAVSKAAVIKLTESLAAETRPHGISVFAIHPGLVRAGLTDSELETVVEDEQMLASVRSWFERQFKEDKTVSAEEAASFVLEVCSGRADALSGRYIAIEDDLDALISQADRVRRENLQALKVERLAGD